MKTTKQSIFYRSLEHSVLERHTIIGIEFGTSGEQSGFKDQLDAVVGDIQVILRKDCVLFCRFFLSDAANQEPLLSDAIQGLKLGAVSAVQQPPLDGSKIAAWVYSVQGKMNPSFSHVWKGGMTASQETSAHSQMLAIFNEYDAFLGERGLSLRQDCLRTWIFAQNVDANYSGVVSGRKEYFDAVGLTDNTHFIASTGIDGRHSDVKALVQMDAYSAGGLKPEQIKYLQAKTHLNPTYEYGVTFERGTAVTYGDRRHVFISGTASIDNQGNVLHPGDILAQTGRMLENIKALLWEAESGFDDVVMAIVYLRDVADAAAVKAYFKANLPKLNAVFVLAPVCRPQWLIEMECIAISHKADNSFESF